MLPKEHFSGKSQPSGEYALAQIVANRTPWSSHERAVRLPVDDDRGLLAAPRCCSSRIPRAPVAAGIEPLDDVALLTPRGQFGTVSVS